jgi:hypothetical protein
MSYKTASQVGRGFCFDALYGGQMRQIEPVRVTRALRAAMRGYRETTGFVMGSGCFHGIFR